MIGDAVAIVISRHGNIVNGAELQQRFAKVAAFKDVQIPLPPAGRVRNPFFRRRRSRAIFPE